MLHSTVQQLVSILDTAYDRRSWHGTNLRGSIRGLSLDQVRWRPSAMRHNIWELVVHAAYWKYVVRRRLTGEARGTFPLKGSNWFERGRTGQSAPGGQMSSSSTPSTGSLRKAIALLSTADLRRTPAGSTVSNFSSLTGIAAHDLYHAGQIQLLKALSRDRQRLEK